ncbi:MAG: DUF1223 domain-containing protein [Pseudomonadota bacterium]
MRYTLAVLSIIIAILLLTSLRGGAQNLPNLPPADAATKGPIVAELFTSQSCSSCPPAEKLFAELSEREDLIVLEWHVDYWDRLVHGRAGSWKDPYSSPDHTDRQRLYNRTLRSSGRVYTPQAVINGVSETVGSYRDEVERQLVAPPHATANVSVISQASQLHVTIEAFTSPLARDADIYRLTLLPSQTTAVPRGENRGSVLKSKNIVLAAEKVGAYSGAAQSLKIAAPKPGETCAILIQEKRGARLGPVLGASYC